MFQEPGQVPTGGVIELDVAIAGGGAAGITLALELADADLRVGLFEGGGLKPPLLDEQHPYNGEAQGRDYSLIGSRLRYFGGSTNHWGGWCRPLEELDFKPRQHVPLSGWPIDRQTLEPFYRKAARICEIEPPGFETPQAGAERRWDYFEAYDPEFVSRTFRFSPPTRFGERYGARIEQSKQVTVWLESTVCEIERDGSRVSGLRIQSNGSEFRARAGAYVIALGGIENARLLLNSDRSTPGGIGNHSGYLGRCFADHAGKAIGLLLAGQAVPYRLHSQSGIRVLPHLSLREDLLNRHGLPNFGAVLSEESTSSLLDGSYLDDDAIFSGWRGSPRNRTYSVVVRFEPTPNPESRVALSREKDAYGMRRTQLDWRINGADFESLDRITELLARKVGRAGIGRFLRYFHDTPAEREAALNYQSHHMGTTRMSHSPAQGVVDPNCRVWGVDNLHLAGSSVFPTFGFANPTLTVVAMAARLAQHLKTELKR